MTMDIPQTSYGIQALIDRLRGEGIEAGRSEAAALLEQARTEIEALRSAAHTEADALLARSREQLRVEQEAAHAALQLAFRDSALRLREDFMHRFGERLRRRVRTDLQDPALLGRLLQQLLDAASAGASSGAGTGAAVAPPAPAQAELDLALDQLAAETSGAMLAEGLELLAAPGRSGLRLRLSEQALELHLTEDAVCSLLLEHLLPRVRRQIEGGPLPGEAGADAPGAGLAAEPASPRGSAAAAPARTPGPPPAPSRSPSL